MMLPTFEVQVDPQHAQQVSSVDWEQLFLDAMASGSLRVWLLLTWSRDLQFRDSMGFWICVFQGLSSRGQQEFRVSSKRFYNLSGPRGLPEAI